MLPPARPGRREVGEVGSDGPARSSARIPAVSTVLDLAENILAAVLTVFAFLSASRACESNRLAAEGRWKPTIGGLELTGALAEPLVGTTVTKAFQRNLRVAGLATLRFHIPAPRRRRADADQRGGARRRVPPAGTQLPRLDLEYQGRGCAGGRVIRRGAVPAPTRQSRPQRRWLPRRREQSDVGGQPLTVTKQQGL